MLKNAIAYTENQVNSEHIFIGDYSHVINAPYRRFK